MTGVQVLHADDTPCYHQAPVVYRGGAWWCPAGRELTHVRLGGTTTELRAAVAAAEQVAAAFVKMMTPVMSLLRELTRLLGDTDPRWRMLAAAVRVADAAEDEEIRGRPHP